MSRIAVAALLGALSLSACAQPSPSGQASTQGKEAPANQASGKEGADATVREALQALAPGMQADYVGAAPFAGFREVLVGGQVLYVSDDGRFLMQSQPFDLQERRPATSEGLKAFRRERIASIPEQDRIVFAPPNPKHTITVFTDIECGYCRRLHEQIGEINRAGIAVEYLAFPRMGMGSDDFRDMVSVWCSADRKQALTSAKAGNGVAKKDCSNPVAMQYTLGQQVGVTGTPAIFAARRGSRRPRRRPAQRREARKNPPAGAGPR